MGETPQWIVFWNTAARIFRRIYSIYSNRTATDGVISDSWSCGKMFLPMYHLVALTLALLLGYWFFGAITIGSDFSATQYLLLD